MPREGLIYRTLIASPSDCEEERRIVKEVVHSWNASNSLYKKAIVEPVMWESHTYSQLGAEPQKLINQQMADSCDFLIGIFWTRLGTSTEKHPSGTIEEIENFCSQKKPVSLYFSSAPVPQKSFEADQDQYLSLCKHKTLYKKRGLVTEFSSINEFRKIITDQFSKIMIAFFVEKEEEEKDQEVLLFQTQFTMFVRKIHSSWTLEAESKASSPERASVILREAVSGLLEFRSYIEEDEDGDVVPVLDRCSKGMHRLAGSNPKVEEAFWKQGNALIEQLWELTTIF